MQCWLMVLWRSEVRFLAVSVEKPQVQLTRCGVIALQAHKASRCTNKSKTQARLVSPFCLRHILRYILGSALARFNTGLA